MLPQKCGLLFYLHALTSRSHSLLLFSLSPGWLPSSWPGTYQTFTAVKALRAEAVALAFFMNAACTPISAKTLTDQFLKMLQGGYPQPGAMPVGYAPYPYAMMPGYPPAPAPVGKAGKAAAGAEPATKGRKRRKRIPQGGPKKPATSFVLFSNTVREQVKEENPGLSFLDLGKKLGEMWREMDPNVRCSLVP